MGRPSVETFAKAWRISNMEKAEKIEALLDSLCSTDREICKMILNIKDWRFLERPSLRKASHIIGMPLTTLHRHVKKIREMADKIL